MSGAGTTRDTGLEVLRKTTNHHSVNSRTEGLNSQLDKVTQT